MTDELADLRAQLDAIDDQLLVLLAQRARVVAQAWASKRARGVSIRDAQREASILAQARQRAVELGLDPDAVAVVMALIVGRDLRQKPNDP